MLAATIQNPVALNPLIQNVVSRFPELEYSDADIAITVRFAAQTGATPLSYCHVTADEETHELTSIEVLEDAWVMTPQPIPFRSLFLSPSGDPNHGRPRYLRVTYGKQENRYLLSDMQNVLICLRATLKRVDPDLILTEWGDTWLLPLLIEKSKEYRIPPPAQPRDRTGHFAQKRADLFFLRPDHLPRPAGPSLRPLPSGPPERHALVRLRPGRHHRILAGDLASAAGRCPRLPGGRASPRSRC